MNQEADISMTMPVDVPPTTPQSSTSRDNRLKAIIFMNIFSIFSATVSILFKILNRKGVKVMEFMLWRNGFNFIMIFGFLFTLRINPFHAD